MIVLGLHPVSINSFISVRHGTPNKFLITNSLDPATSIHFRRPSAATEFIARASALEKRDGNFANFVRTIKRIRLKGKRSVPGGCRKLFCKEMSSLKPPGGRSAPALMKVPVSNHGEGGTDRLTSGRWTKRQDEP